MDRGNTKHGVVRDDVMKREVEGVIRDEHATHAEEWADPEAPGGKRPEGVADPEGALVGGVPHGMTSRDVELRSALAAHLGKEIYPARRDQLLIRLSQENAPDRLVDLVAGLPADDEFENVQDIAVALGLHVESERF
jgi:hypothetical protein